MADDICFALLRNTLYQILHSVGFESSHGEPANVLADIFGQYIQLLASSASTHAHLAGRSVASPWDIADGLGDVQVTLDQLEEWLDSEQGQFLTPSWSKRADPSIILKDVVTMGQVHHEMGSILYQYDTMDQQYHQLDNVIKDSHPIAVTPPVTTTTTTTITSHPDYVPSHLPSFPTTDANDVLDLPDQDDPTIPSSSYPTTLSSLLPSTSSLSSSKKVNDNPFTQLVSFDQSSLALGNSLFLTLPSPLQKHKQEDGNDDEDLERAKKRRRAEINGSMETTINTIMRKYQQEKHVYKNIPKGGNQRMFQHITQNEAAPGKTLLGTRDGMLDEMVYRLAPPVALARLSSPNLMMDTTLSEDNDNNKTPSIPIVVETAIPPIVDDSKHGSPSQLDPPQPTVKVPMSLAMLSARVDSTKKDSDNGKDDTTSLLPPQKKIKKPRKPIDTNNNPSTIPPLARTVTPPPRQPSVKAGSNIHRSPTTTPPPRQLPLKTNTSNSALTATTISPTHQYPAKIKTDNPTIPSRPVKNNNINPTLTTTTIPPPPRPVKTNVVHTTPTPVSRPQQPVKTHLVNPVLTTLRQESVTSTNFNLSTPANIIHPTMASTQKTNLTTATKTHTHSTFNTPPILKKKKKKKDDPLSATLKVRFEQESPAHHAILSSSSSPVPSRESEPWRTSNQQTIAAYYDTSETVRCICENPTVDYGTFMISCDRCLVWFHGTCVGITEQMLMEEWVCSRCR